MAKSMLPMPELKMSGNLRENWEEFEENFDDYCVLQEYRKDGKEKLAEELASLRLAMGNEGRKVIKLNITLTDKEKKDPKITIRKLRTYFSG